MSMVERERDEGDAIALTGGGGGQLEQEGAVPVKAEGERDGKERDTEGESEEEKDRDHEAMEWSEIRLAIEELSTAAESGGGGGDGKPAASSPPTLPFLALSHLLLRVFGELPSASNMFLIIFSIAWKLPSVPWSHRYSHQLHHFMRVLLD